MSKQPSFSWQVGEPLPLEQAAFYTLLKQACHTPLLIPGIQAWLRELLHPKAGPVTVRKATILDNALDLVFGDREADYSHPRDDYEKVAAMVNGLFAGKLKEPLSAADCALFMILVKLAREAHKHKRDNLVDIAGYAEVVARITGEDP